MLTIQEREELDYQTGVASELQNAYARSKMEIAFHDDTQKIKELVAAGKHVVITSGPVFCPSTDAYIGRTVYIEGSFDTRDEAMVLFNEMEPGATGDIDLWVEPIVRPELPPISEAQDIFLRDDSPF